MATASTASFEELTKTASDFVTSQSGMWDHKAWMDFLARVRTTGVEISEDMQPKLGDLLEAMREYHTAVSSTDDIEQAMSTVFNESVAFIKRQKGVWGHAEWEDFSREMLEQGGDLRKYYPPSKEGWAEYVIWCKERGRPHPGKRPERKAPPGAGLRKR